MQGDPAAASLYVPLPKPPTARTFTVRKLIASVQEGAVRVPPFQRPLRWQASDVVTLFDSVLRGYPIGSLMLWARSFEADDRLRVGNALLRAPAGDGWFIVDGQQRVTALAASLLDLDQMGDRRWEIRYDPSAGVFLAGPASPEEARRQVPLRALGDLRRLARWFPECDLSEAEKDRVEEVQQRILDYEIPAYVVETDDVDALRGVFARLNATGVRMLADEVFQALLGQDGGPSHPRRGVDLGALQAAADLDGFGQPPRSSVLNALFAMSGLDPGKRLDDVGDEVLGKLVGEDDAIEAIQRTVGFLAAPLDAAEPGAGIPAYAFLPYPALFVLLARWFHHFPDPGATERRALGLWVWRAIAKSVQQGAPVSAMRARVRMFEGEDSAGSIARLVEAVGEPTASEWKLGPFHATRPASKVEILALLDRGPRDRDGLVSWRALPSGDGVARKIFHVSRIGEPSVQALAKTAANRVLLDARPGELWRDLRTWSWERDREAAESHLIDEEALADLGRNDVSRFLLRRAARLRVTGTDLPSWLENLLPERGSQLRKRLSTVHGVREGQSFELLRALGGDLLGAVEARADAPQPADGAAPPSSGTEAPAEEGDDLRPRVSALTGLQLKFSMFTWEDRLGWKAVDSKGKRPGPTLALRLGRRTHFRQIDESALSAFAAGTHPWAEEEVRAGILRARDAWPAVADSAPSRMRAALADHWRLVPLLFHMGSPMRSQ